MKILVTTLRAIGCMVLLCSCDEEPPQTTEPVRALEERAPGAATPPSRGPGNRQFRASCPMALEDVDVRVSDSKDGVALTFSTDASNLDELRERVVHLAEMYEMHAGHRSMMWHRMGRHGRGAGGGGPMGKGHMRGAGHGRMPAASASTTEVDGGIRLVLTPKDPSQLEALREHAHGHQERMQAGACWMAHEGPPSTGQPDGP